MPKPEPRSGAVGRAGGTEAQMSLARASIDPDRLIARQRARRAKRRIARDVLRGMRNQRRAVKGRRRRRLRLIAGNVRVAMMLWRLVGIGPSLAGAECHDGG